MTDLNLPPMTLEDVRDVLHSQYGETAATADLHVEDPRSDGDARLIRIIVRDGEGRPLPPSYSLVTEFAEDRDGTPGDALMDADTVLADVSSEDAYKAHLQVPGVLEDVSAYLYGECGIDPQQTLEYALGRGGGTITPGTYRLDLTDGQVRQDAP